jgi:hypothetical protein
MCNNGYVSPDARLFGSQSGLRDVEGASGLDVVMGLCDDLLGNGIIDGQSPS